ncbi:hypothetical protein KF913_20325 [Candidatus Obscuribacterales bacterium]|nr:hypothetical protein [Candidatus Obscuribacterales bacterium]
MSSAIYFRAVSIVLLIGISFVVLNRADASEESFSHAKAIQARPANSAASLRLKTAPGLERSATRIDRPVSCDSKDSSERDSAVAKESSFAKTGRTCFATSDRNADPGGGPESAQPECCSSSGSSPDGPTEAPVANANDYFSYRLASPQEHFDMWLKLNLYPALCHTVLCRRQCALNGYESCNALGVKRSILSDAVQNRSSCDSGGCGADR